MILAIEQYKKVLTIYPKFGMVTGNYGMTLQYYADLMFDQTHKTLLHEAAILMLNNAINATDLGTYDEAKQNFKKYLELYAEDSIARALTTSIPLNEPKYDDKEELKYRNWVLDKSLFLNPLGDLPYQHIAFATDILQLPDILVKLGSKPVFHGLLNQLKQEFIFARYQYYCGLQDSEKTHFADKDTFLLQFEDYPQYSIRIEQIKSAFKTLYSLLDKIAFFINAYFDLGIKDQDVSFFNIWKSEKPGRGGYKFKTTLRPDDNYGIGALYWIGKDFHESFLDSPNPQARRIKDIRNALEHRYSKIYWDSFDGRASGEVDDLAIYISEGELIDETMRLLRLIREAIISLVIAVRIEEDNRKTEAGDQPVVGITLLPFDDEWKR